MLSNSLTIQFRGKIRSVYRPDDTLLRREVKVPTIKRSHCNMHAFRTSRRFGSYANSDLFHGLLKRELSAMKLPEYLDVDHLPEGVSVDESGFLASVTIELAD